MFIEQPLFKASREDSEVEFSAFMIDDAFAQKISNDELNVERTIEAILEEISSNDDEIDKFTNHADGLDYMIAVVSGVLTGIIDSVYVGELKWDEAKANAHEEVNRFIIKKAKADGYTGDRLDGAIKFLEDKYKIPSDNIWRNSGYTTPRAHHLDDLAHHPTLIGLIANIVATMFCTAFFSDKNGHLHLEITKVDKKELITLWAAVVLAGVLNWLVIIAERKYSEKQEKEIPKPIRVLIHLLASAPAVIMILKEAHNWIGHLISDMGGSKSSAGRGMGIPGLFLSLLKEISAIPAINKTRLPQLLNEWYSKGHFDLRKELAVLDIAKKQMVPVIINEVLVRGFYFVRHLILEAQQHKDNWEDYDWEKTLPFGNRTIDRMLTIAHGSFVAVDVADAAIRTAISGEYADVATFLSKMALRVNFVGIGRFTIALGAEMVMTVQRSNRVNKKIDLQAKLLNFYNVKICYKERDTWIAAENAEVAIHKMNQVAVQAFTFFEQSQREIKENIKSIISSADKAELHNPGIKKDLLSFLK